jgi:hypothetical protein
MQKNNSAKISIPSIIITSLCIATYLAALVSAALKIYSHIEQRRDIAIEEFITVKDIANDAGNIGFMDENFIETVNEALAGTETLEGLIIYSPNGEYPFERTRGQALSWTNNSLRFKSNFGFSGQRLYLPLDIQYIRNVNIEGKASAFDYGFITGVLKQSLLLVLAALLIAFFTLLVEALLDKSSGKRPAPQPHKRAEGQDFSRSVEPRAPASPAPQAPAPHAPPAREKTQELPKGLYTERGKIGWEEYTHERLDSELQRCASNEQDLVLLCIEYKSSCLPYEGFYRRLAQDAVDFFSSRDMVFEKGSRGISVIDPNIDLEAAFAKSIEFHQRCLQKYPDVFTSRPDLCIGLSSRSGRIIDARRLVFEAAEALEKAHVDPFSPIVAFKSDPEKYRAFIASQN